MKDLFQEILFKLIIIFLQSLQYSDSILFPSKYLVNLIPLVKKLSTGPLFFDSSTHFNGYLSPFI